MRGFRGLRAYQGERRLKEADEAIHNEKGFQFLAKGFCFFFILKKQNKKLFLYKIVNYEIFYSIMCFKHEATTVRFSFFSFFSFFSSERMLIPAMV